MVEDAQILFDAVNRVVVKGGTILLDVIHGANLKVESICGGKGNCGKCKVIIVKGSFSFRIFVEKPSAAVHIFSIYHIKSRLF